ncbi:MAG: hypothetical protein Q9227_003694 [Pyrenula ochraceoflavens]
MSPKIEDLQKDAINSIAGVSTLLRNAIAAALPVAPEQYLTMAIPGTVIDLEDYDQGGSFVYDVRKHAVAPTTVRQSEARLIGNTGKSVARSYSRSLDALVPAKATISSSDGIRSPGNDNYNNAMNFLLEKDPEGRNVVEVYRDKQKAWGQARSDWDTARINAEEEAVKKFPSSSGDNYIGKQKRYINDWNQQNYYKYKTAAQAAWMDWVVNGQKYNVDYNFGMIDIDSIMTRIESSKESLRNATIPDADGANEVYGVSLTPNRWATYCKRKAEGWYDRNGNYTLGQLDAEIARLESLLNSFTEADKMVKDPNQEYPVHDAKEPPVKPTDTQREMEGKLDSLYKAQGNLAGAKYNNDQVQSDKNAPADKKTESATALKTAADDVLSKQKELQDAQHAHERAQQDWNDFRLLTLQDNARNDVTGWIDSKKTTIEAQLKRLNELRTEKMKSDPVTVPVITGATAPKDDQDKDTPHGTSIAPEGSELANPIFRTKASNAGATPPPTGGATQSPPSAEDADPWTTITFSYSATDQATSATQSSWGMKVGGSVGFGLWSVGGSYAHDESHSDMQSDMAACDVSISFSALVVNIDRPWLYGELFQDIDLGVADGVKLSPGALRLHRMIQDQSLDQIGEYSQFPAYPTSFIVAADTTIEFNGSTKHIEQHFNSHSNSGGLSVGYGPWSVSSSFHEEGSDQKVQMHTTSTGCKLSFGAPQVIAWVSQILPALPREADINPLTQGAGVPIPTTA